MGNNQGKKLTIDKVAELCGVSKTTISRFLNGKYDNMSPETKERIASVVSELNYHPNRSAQRLKSEKSGLIGCIIADAGNPFSAILLKGISRCCEAAGYQVLFADSRESASRELRAIQGFLENRVDGLLINTTGGNNEFLAELNGKLPIVLVDRLVNNGDFDTVSSPNYEIAYKTTKLLLEMGYENVTVISEMRKNISPRTERYRGYCAAMEEEGLCPSDFQISSEDNAAGIAEYLADFSEKNKGKRLAIICANGVAALNSLLAAASLNIKFGYEFGCCSFDDWNWLQLSRPKITTIQLGTEEKGYESAKLLLERINKEPGLDENKKHIIVNSTTIIRNSTISRQLDVPMTE